MRTHAPLSKPMTVSVTVQEVRPRRFAAVQRTIDAGSVRAAWKPALDTVWKFLRTHPGLRSDGHNIFLFHHADVGAPMLCEFGVEITHAFQPVGEVYSTETPGGEAAIAVHRGPYTGLKETHTAIQQWMTTNHRMSAGQSWEIYGDPTPDPANTETTVVYLLRAVVEATA